MFYSRVFDLRFRCGAWPASRARVDHEADQLVTSSLTICAHAADDLVLAARNIKDRKKKRSAALILQAFPVNVCRYYTSQFSVGEQILRATVLMENESWCSTIPRRLRNPLGLQLPTQLSGQDGNEIELLKNQPAEAKTGPEESQNETGAAPEAPRRTTHQRTLRQVDDLPENESHANTQFQVGYCK